MPKVFNCHPARSQCDAVICRAYAARQDHGYLRMSGAEYTAAVNLFCRHLSGLGAPMFARYADTTHFRAPYKEAYFHGVGADPVLMTGVKDSRGYFVMTPSDAAAVRNTLKGLVVLETGNTVFATPTAAGMAATQAADWVTSKLRSGFVVLVQFAGPAQYAMAAIPKANASDIALKSQAAPVYAEPSFLDSIGVSTMQVAIGVGVIAAAYLFLRK